MTSPLESSIERRSVEKLEKLGYVCIKFGRDGWPDRLVLYAPGRCVWLEFKNAQGRIRPAQKIRKRQLEEAGHVVHFPRTVEEALGAVAQARRSLERARARR